MINGAQKNQIREQMNGFYLPTTHGFRPLLMIFTKKIKLSIAYSFKKATCVHSSLFVCINSHYIA